jgi:hypothetical protein
MREPALARLNEIVRSNDTTDADALKAILAILNRTGLSERVSVEVEVSPFAQLAKALVARGITVEQDDFIDAEVVEDDDG